MNGLLTILTSHELFLILIGAVTYVALFVVTVQNSRRKIAAMQERLDRAHALQEQYDIEGGRQKIAELESLIRKLGDENSMLQLELEEKRLALEYNNKVAVIENAKRQQAETVIFSSDVFRRIQECLNAGRSLSFQDWADLTQLVDSIYTGFTEKLYSLYPMSEQELHVSLLTKIHLQSRDIALLTALLEGVRPQRFFQGLGRLRALALKWSQNNIIT